MDCAKLKLFMSHDFSSSHTIQINYWRKNYDKEVDAMQNIIELKPGQENIDRGLIIGLEPVMWYRFNVQAYNTAGNGDKSSDYDRQTLNRRKCQSYIVFGMLQEF